MKTHDHVANQTINYRPMMAHTVPFSYLKATAVTVLNQWFVTQYTQKIPMTHFTPEFNCGLSLLWWIWLSGIGNLQFVPRMPSSISSPRFFKSSNYLDLGPVQQNHTLFENMLIQWVKLTDIHHTHTYACTYVHIYIYNYAYAHNQKVCKYTEKILTWICFTMFSWLISGAWCI